MSVSAPYPFIDIAGEAPADRMARYQQYKASIDAALSQAAGFEREQLLAKSADAQKALDNATRIAQIQAQTSRYGVDAQSATELAKLKQDAKQFDATHQLDMQKFGLDVQKTGLDYANTATQYLSTPDKYFQGANYINMAGRALGRTTNGSQGAAPYGSLGTPTPKNENDFAVLAGYTMPTASGVGTATTGSSQSANLINNAQSVGAGQAPQPNPGTGGGTDNGDVVAAAGGGSDARIKALRAMIDAVPPSNVDGLNQNDYAVLQAAKALYSTNLTPQAWSSLKADPANLGVNRSAGARLGYDPSAWEAQQNRNGLGMGSAGSVRGY